MNGVMHVSACESHVRPAALLAARACCADILSIHSEVHKAACCSYDGVDVSVSLSSVFV